MKKITLLLITLLMLICFASADYTLTKTINGVSVSTTVPEGRSVTLKYLKDTSIFTKWVVKSGSVTLSSDTATTVTFTMPASNVEIQAVLTTDHTHSYSEATCTIPPTCSCGETNGEALGHNFVDATCTTAKTCSRCSITEGSALGHSYTGTVTCNVNGSTDSVQCVRCSATESQTCTHTYTISKGTTTNGTITLSSTSVKAGASVTATITPNDGYKISTITVNGTSVTVSDSTGMDYTISSVTANTTITVTFGVAWNAPKLATGLTPVNWNGSAWVTTTESAWDYNYKSVATVTHSTIAGNGNGKWANAQTADGSQYVWIPRYSYKITSGEHTSGNSWNSLDSAGTNKIEIKFSNGTTDNTSDGYIAHPAFTFGSTELTGIWVAKYEASRNDATDTSGGNGTNATAKPGVYSWLPETIDEAFSVSYNLNRSLESHLIKNSEWGAVTYLTNAIGRIPYINTSYFTGYSAPTQDTYCYDDSTTYLWNTADGVKASTTHNVYGIYDMSGCNGELVAAYVDNGNAVLMSNGESLVNAEGKYKDIYPMGNNDTEIDNYNAWNSIKGDAVYEVSNWYDNGIFIADDISWDYDWFTDVPYGEKPFMKRGYGIGGENRAGIFAIVIDSGLNKDNSLFQCGFRVVLAIP